jgi:hypothetical protein
LLSVETLLSTVLSVVVAVLSVEALSVVVADALSVDDVVLLVVDELPQPARHPATIAAVNKILTGFFIINSLFLINLDLHN